MKRILGVAEVTLNACFCIGQTALGAVDVAASSQLYCWERMAKKIPIPQRSGPHL